MKLVPWTRRAVKDYLCLVPVPNAFKKTQLKAVEPGTGKEEVFNHRLVARNSLLISCPDPGSYGLTTLSAERRSLAPSSLFSQLTV